MTAVRLRTVALVAVPVFAIGGFVLDMASPLGIADWVWYFIPLLLLVYVGGRLLPILLAAVLSLLMLAGFFLSPPGIDPHLAMLSRLMGVSVMWVMAFVIWQRKRAEAELLLSKQRLALHVEQTPLAVIQWDSDFNVQEWNPAAEKVFGYTREEAVGRHYGFIVPDSARPQADAVGRDLMNRRGGQRFTNENITKDGKIITCEWFSTTLVDPTGKIIGVASLVQDITERRLAERQLAETLDFNQKIISDASAGILVYKASGQCVLANEAAARTVSGTVPQLLSQDFRQLESWRASGMLRVAEEALATGKPQQYETHFVSTFGKDIWLVGHFTSFVQGNEPHLLFIFNDIIGRKQAEEHVREQAALLDKAQDAIFVLDSDDRIIYWNKSAERIYGWTAAEAIGKTAVELLFKGVITSQLAKTIKTLNERGE